MAENRSIPQNWMRVFLPIWIAQSFSLLGSGLVQFALVWWLTQKTGSATVLATATLMALLPDVILGPFAGALVDRWNRKVVMIVADGSIALMTALIGVLYWSGHIQVWHIYVLMFLRETGAVFHWPAMQASTSLMVPEEHLSRVAGINQSLRGALNIATPPLGALLMTVLPLYGILSIDVSTAAIAVGILFFIVIPQPARAAGAGQVTPATVLLDVKAGLKYVWSWPGMMAILLMATVINFAFYPVNALMPLLITRHFGGGAWHLGAMESVFGFGVVAGGLLLGAWGGFRRKVYTSLSGLILMGLSFTLVAVAPPNGFTLALIGMGLGGIMNVIVNGPLMALVQAKVAPEMQGRVFMLIQSIATAMGPLSMLLAGPIADHLGVRPWYLFAAIVNVVLGAGAFLVPAIRNLEASSPKPSSELIPAVLPQETGD